MMKKLAKVLLAGLLTFGLAACSSNKTPEENEPETLKVICTLDPHSKILEEAKPILLEKYNINLEITISDDYYIQNKVVDTGEQDANYFQHIIFFNNEKAEHGYKIANAGDIHLEPFGFYSKTIKDVSELKDGATIIISDSVSDNGRILAILQDAGLIKIKDGVETINATIADIEENKLNLQFKEVKPEFLTTAYANEEGDLVAINGNYAIQGGLNPSKDAIILEATEDNPYVNIVACQEGHENDAKIKALVEVLKSDEIKQFIETTYQGSVIVAE